MCRALYIASDEPLALIEWDEADPGFCVLKLQDHDEAVRNQFKLPYVVYAGSFEGCSCGFAYDEQPLEDDADERRHDARARESVKSLGDYVSDVLASGGVELFACWDGDQSLEPEVELTVGLEFFEQKEFGFEDTSHMKVVKS